MSQSLVLQNIGDKCVANATAIVMMMPQKP